MEPFMRRQVNASSILAWCLLVAMVSLAVPPTGARTVQPQQQQQFATPTPPIPLFFREEWRQTGRFDASTSFRPQHPVTPQALTNPNLEMKVYDPGAGRIA